MARLSDAEKIDWLQLCRSGGVGPRTFSKLLERFGTARRAYEELPRLMREAGGGDRWRRCRRDEAEAELGTLRALGAHLIAHTEPDYPARLAEIADPPPLLAVLGEPALLAAPAVAIIGARNASGHGRMLAKTLAKDLAEAGLVVVSGLARGIDTAAHEGALAAGGATVAVIASGIDVPYPPDNEALMAQIAASGAVVSERPPGAVPQARHFPRRNRIIAGLCLGVVVVEAAPQSGSLITARLAAEQGREVMAVPGSPLDPRHRGTNQLLRDGATLVESAADIRSALGNALDVATTPIARPRRREAPPSVPRPKPASVPPPPAGDLLGRLQERLGVEPLLVDELIRQCHATSAEVQQALLELELEGRIERHPGNRVSLASFSPGRI
jgi:DNA processing protein